MSLEFEFRISAVTGSNLTPVDITTSDPYVVFNIGGKKKWQTEVVQKNCNPTFKFNECVGVLLVLQCS
jgi:Ca2+-dependent lipid-binding protein